MKQRTQTRLFIIAVITVASIAINLPKTIPYFNVPKPQLSLGPFHRDLELKMGLDIQGGSRLTYQANVDNIPQNNRLQALESAKKVIESRVNFFGVSEASVQSIISKNDYRVSIELPGIQDINQAISLIGKTAQLDFREFKSSSDSAQLEVPTLENTISTGVTGKDMGKFQISFNSQNGTPAVAFETTSEGRPKFAAATRKLIGKPLIAFLDDQVISIATVQTEIDGKGQISGKFTTKEAKALSSLFNAGSLPLPLKLIQQENIGATLGKESIQKSIRGGLVGLGIVIFFMVGYYGKLGLVSSLGLFIYGLISLAVYRLIPITLTLPGIAGFILSVGMAVDSNILIFERLKEELRAGKPWNIALELAFGRAWESIKDANIATLITTFILFNPLNWNFLNSSGMIRGFALTLFLGIVIGLFTGIFVTRTLLRFLFSKNTKPL